MHEYMDSQLYKDYVASIKHPLLIGQDFQGINLQSLIFPPNRIRVAVLFSCMASQDASNVVVGSFKGGIRKSVFLISRTVTNALNPPGVRISNNLYLDIRQYGEIITQEWRVVNNDAGDSVNATELLFPLPYDCICKG